VVLSTAQAQTARPVAATDTQAKDEWSTPDLLAGATWKSIHKVTDFKLFYIGDTPVTPGSLVKFVLIVVFGFLLSWFIRRLLLRIQRRREKIAESSSFYTLGRILHYLIMTIAVLVAFTSLGLDASSLALIAGALSVGIGFGLQSIVSNFLSGLILLFEGSLRVGDFIELDSGITGVVKEISTRYTRINTNDNVDVVVPNSELVSFKLTNWTLREPVVRVRIPFGVAYGTDKELVRKAALEAADEVPLTMKSIPGRTPEVLLLNFGDSSLDFELRVWVSRQGVQRPVWGKAAYYWALETKFREYGIEIPFPQRDLHMREKPAQE
jgi:small-conductance mechanosensitive channel